MSVCSCRTVAADGLHAGFSLASGFGIHYHDFPKDDPVPFFLAQELIPGWLKANRVEEATYCPPKGYFVPTGKTVIDETQYQGADRPIRVLRLELK